MVIASLAIPSALALTVFCTYDLGIIAFLCGNAWSTALLSRTASAGSRTRVLIASNLIVLAAIAAIAFVEPPLLLTINAALFALILAFDLTSKPFERQPRYYRRMRITVTSGVLVLHGLALGQL